MIRRPPRSTRTDTPFPTRRSSDLVPELAVRRPVHVVGAEHGAHKVADPGLADALAALDHRRPHHRSEEHTSELQSLMRSSYAVFCLKKKKTPINDITKLHTPIKKNVTT